MQPFRRITGPSAQQRVRATQRAALNSAMDRGTLTSAAAAHVELPADKRQKARVWTDTDTDARIAEWLRPG
ncbi:hypothetical protein [Streptomyces sp. G-G2]|uniref:hypothetical protein n=1 Tax=Streptomyces sp. G-G2 TaxID=3046201 RepID=UPI0024BA9559|nr:hypothetical protein [Streptomyces sp. G-G2]MDJ0385852.1 hypothetical protein [Streptomyces sp. G-G2]